MPDHLTMFGWIVVAHLAGLSVLELIYFARDRQRERGLALWALVFLCIEAKILYDYSWVVTDPLGDEQLGLGSKVVVAFLLLLLPVLTALAAAIRRQDSMSCWLRQLVGDEPCEDCRAAQDRRD